MLPSIPMQDRPWLPKWDEILGLRIPKKKKRPLLPGVFWPEPITDPGEHEPVGDKSEPQPTYC